MSQTVMLQHVK